MVDPILSPIIGMGVLFGGLFIGSLVACLGCCICATCVSSDFVPRIWRGTVSCSGFCLKWIAIFFLCVGIAFMVVKMGTWLYPVDPVAYEYVKQGLQPSEIFTTKGFTRAEL